MPELYRPLSRSQRLKLQEAVGEAVVVKRAKADGTVTVTLVVQFSERGHAQAGRTRIESDPRISAGVWNKTSTST